MKKDLDKYIRSIPDFPKEGVIFKDITTLLEHPQGFKDAVDALYEELMHLSVDKVVGIESRGFIFGGILAEKLGAGFVPVRKPGKLPYHTEKEKYDLEYGSDCLEIHKGAIKKGEKVLLHDDLLATGGTAQAAARLVEKLGGEVIMLSFLLELTFLNGREKLKGYEIHSVIKY